MNAQDWFSQDELLAELSRVGITLPERTLRFWVANGVLSAPIKKPYRGADGRVGYFPREALTLVPEILRLQSEGWKLRQSKARLAQTQDLPKSSKPAAQELSDGGQEWAPVTCKTFFRTPRAETAAAALQAPQRRTVSLGRFGTIWSLDWSDGSGVAPPSAQPAPFS